MTLTIKTAENAWLEGRARFQEWVQQDEADWFEPLGRSLMALLVSRMAPEELEALAMMNPQGFDMMQSIVSGGANA